MPFSSSDLLWEFHFLFTIFFHTPPFRKTPPSQGKPSQRNWLVSHHVACSATSLAWFIANGGEPTEATPAHLCNGTGVPLHSCTLKRLSAMHTIALNHLLYWLWTLLDVALTHLALQMSMTMKSQQEVVVHFSRPDHQLDHYMSCTPLMDREDRTLRQRPPAPNQSTSEFYAEEHHFSSVLLVICLVKQIHYPQ